MTSTIKPDRTRLNGRLVTRLIATVVGVAFGIFVEDQLAQAQALESSNAAIDRTVGTEVAPPAPLNVSPSGMAVAAPHTVGPQNAAFVAAALTITSAGRTAGQFSVGPTGGASYNIPLWTPPGARDIEPHLALHYVSGAPDGALGPGWQLTGFSTITRCGKTWVSNGGTLAGVTLSTSDDLCLDGNRLRLTSGTQGVAGSTYQGEIADFSNVTAYGVAGNGPAYFIVQGKDGRSYEYGNTADSQIFASGSTTPYMWAVNKIRDRQVNNMVFTYTAGSIAIPSTIKYTATPGTGVSFGYEVDFNYVARTGGTTLTKYVAGSTVSQANQLDNVTVLSSGTIVRKYLLSYSASPTTNRPLLNSVQECGGSAGTDCLRPTVVAYQAGAQGWATTATATGLTGQYGFVPMDLNGDGIPDALYGKVSGANIHWYAKIATVAGYGSELDTGATSASTSAAPLVAAFAGKGAQQFMLLVGTTYMVYSYNGTAFTSAPVASSGVSPMLVADYDGDGLPDLVSQLGADVVVRRNTTPAGGAISFDTALTTIYSYAGSNFYLNGILADFNGDGRQDLVATHFTAKGAEHSTALISNGFGALATAVNYGGAGEATQIGDLNGDGCSDIFTVLKVYVSNCAGAFTQVATGVSAGGSAYIQFFAVDWDGDGQTDLLYGDYSSNTWMVQKSTGAGLAAGVSTSVPAAWISSSTQSKNFFLMDRDSDGELDLAYVDTANSYAVGYYPHLGVNTPPDLANSITDGFGINFSPTYTPISQNNYSVGGGALFPEVDFQGPLYVVNQFSASDGTGGTYSEQFWYYKARLNHQGRGFEGFETARMYDTRSGLYTFTTYRQDFPYTGSISEQDIDQGNATTPITKTSNTYSKIDLSGTNCSSRCFPYAATTTVSKYEVGGSKNGVLISTANSSFTYDSYGSITQTATTLTDQDPASPFSGQVWTSTMTNTITNDTTNWCLGRPSSTTTQKTAPGMLALTRRVDHTIDYVTCRATAEIIEPTNTFLKATTNFGYDSCGNVNSVSVIGLDKTGAPMPARTTLTSYGTRCQFPELVTNALGQQTLIGNNYAVGLKSSITDPNGIAVSWLYDNFTRKTKETRPDSTSTTWAYADCVSASCWGLPDLRFLVTETLFNSAGATVRTGQRFSDGLDRPRYEEGNRVLGVWTSKVASYDSLGRKITETLPSSTADNANGYHQYTYDSVNRPILESLHDSTGAVYRSSNIGYLGQTVTIQDPNGNTTTKTVDVTGKLRKVVDPAPGGTTNYDYDSFGNLVQILDATNITSSYSYNILGFKTGSSDADTGSWIFTPDSLNELVSQTDAKGQVTSFGVDPLGRVTSRTETESTTATTFTFGTSAAGHNIGQLVSVSKPDGFTEARAFDSFGRPSTAVYTEDGVSYQFDYNYNSMGTVDTLTYPTGPTGGRFVVKYMYDAYGYLNKTQNSATGKVYWQLGAANDSSLPTSESLGNGVQISSAYTAWTNEIITRTEGTGGSTTNLQSLSYSWDLNGNLHQRQDSIQGLAEVFAVDALNRVKTGTLNGNQNLSATYNAAGNLLTKGDVGSYAYTDPNHPHAATTAGSWSMSYDANGNVTSRAGGSISWYSYNLPSLINYNGSSAQFSYDGNHQRWKQVANYAGTTETIHYIAGMLEVVTRGSITEYRHQIPAGSGGVIFTVRSDCSTNTYYATSDHLGSSDLVMDSTGTVLSRESFTPFGARRGSNWQGSPSSSDYNTFTATTRRGFTGHEMLDAVSLVHMNGRVYDAFLGKFLSPDNVVQSLQASQSINPYSYAWNDPLRYVDPTGHSLLGDIIGALVGIAIAIWAPQLLPAFISSNEYAVVFVAGFAGGFVGTAISTGSLSAAFTAGIISGFTALAFNAVGTYAASGVGAPWRPAVSVLAHAAVGCASAAASGGNCGKGAFAAAVSEAANQSGLLEKPTSLGHWGTTALGTAEAGLVGGVASSVAGGSFDNGFSVSAAGYLFNSAWHSKIGKILTDDYGKEVHGPAGTSVLIPDDVDIHAFATAGELFASIGAPEQPFPNFLRGGLWDIQRVGDEQEWHSEFRDAATIVIGVYSAAAKIPFDQLMAGQNAVGALGSYSERMDSVWTHLPARNVADTRIGYSLYQSGRIKASP